MAAPFVYGNLKQESPIFSIHSTCANSGRAIEIEMDRDLRLIRMSEGASPMLSLPLLTPTKIKSTGIVDKF